MIDAVHLPQLLESSTGITNNINFIYKSVCHLPKLRSIKILKWIY